MGCSFRNHGLNKPEIITIKNYLSNQTHRGSCAAVFLPPPSPRARGRLPRLGAQGRDHYPSANAAESWRAPRLALAVRWI